MGHDTHHRLFICVCVRSARASLLNACACVRSLILTDSLQIWWEHSDRQKLHELFNLCLNACSNSVHQFTFAHRMSSKTKFEYYRTFMKLI
jgi:hypothetical protein